MGRPRVLLVDDDTSIRRFVALALDDLDIDLITCASVPEALEVLRHGSVQLLVTDLMMPGVSGLDLLQRLADDPTLRGGARLAIFSAGLNAATQQHLDRFDIWRQLSKPISVSALEQCVAQAVGPDPATAAPPTPPAPEEGSLDAPALDDAERAAIEQHFGGDLGLFLAFRASCIGQFAVDLRTGDDALARGDLVALRHLAHSLKSVLLTLGHPHASEIARQLERACAQAADAAPPLWVALRDALHPLSRHA